MSKAFEKFLEQSKKEGFTIYPGDRHHAAYVAWNAALEHAAEVCDAAAFSSPEPMRYMECAEAICKEKTE
jgi:hypothetical protein